MRSRFERYVDGVKPSERKLNARLKPFIDFQNFSILLSDYNDGRLRTGAA